MNILDINITEVTFAQAVERGKEFLETPNFNMVFTPNPEIIYLAQENPELKTALSAADMLLPDGIGVVLAGKILYGAKTPVRERVAGYDFLLAMLDYCSQTNKSVYFLGGKPGIAEKAAANLPNLNVIGTHDGYSPLDENIVSDLLVVALGAPKQEIFIYNNRAKFPNVRLAIGVGGALDVLAGKVKRAPAFWQKAHLEWLYRAIKQPSRFKRLLTLPKFLYKLRKK